MLPALAFLIRGGKPLHFLADWNFCLIPGVSFFYRRAGVITVTRKKARPHWLNLFKPRFVEPHGALERSSEILTAGGSIAIFPEGTANRSPGRLLPGHLGAALLSLSTKTPVLPVGIRFAGCEQAHRIPLSARLTLTVHAPMHPKDHTDSQDRASVRAWHAAIMTEVARLSGRQWQAAAEARC